MRKKQVWLRPHFPQIGLPTCRRDQAGQVFDVLLEILVLFLGTAFAAGLVDCIAGGGGLIAAAGRVTALATNKRQALPDAGQHRQHWRSG